MEMMDSIRIAATGLRAEQGRMRVISENIANADSTAADANGDPYRRKIPTFNSDFNRELEAQTVSLGRVQRDTKAFRMDYDPGNPAANAQGYVKKPNVDSLVEQMDMRDAQRAYEANLNVVTAARRMISRTLDILKG